MPTPSRIGGYEVERSLEPLPFGELLAARGEGGEPLLLMRLRAEEVARRQDPETFLATIRRISSLEIPGVLRVMGAGRQGEDLVVVVRGTDGPTLAEVLARGPLDGERVVRIARQVADALGQLRAAGFPHGDVRPGTIHLPGRGLAVLAPPTFLPLTPEDQEPAFLAPEVLGGGAGDSAADVFSLGVVVYRALTGRCPFPGDTVEAVLAAMRQGVVDDPAVHAAAIPAGLPEILLEMLDENPARRPTELGARLKIIEEGRTPAPPASPVPLLPLSPRPAATPRTRVGRLRIPAAGSVGSLLYDLLDDVAHLGLDAEGAVVASPEPPARPHCRVTRAALGDVLEVDPQAPERPRVNGSLFDWHELHEGDVVSFGERQVLYELEPPVLRPIPVASAAPPARADRRGEGVFLAVGLILSAAVVVGAILAYRHLRERGREIVDRAAALGSRTAPLPEPAGDLEAVRTSDALQEALAWKRGHPHDIEGRRALLDEIVDRWPASQAAERARAEIEELESDRLEVERDELLGAEVRAKQLVDAGRHGDAERLYLELAARWTGSPTAEHATRAAEGIRRAIGDRWEADATAVDELVGKGDLAGAVARLRGVLVYADEPVTRRVEERLAEMENAIAEKILARERPSPPAAPDTPVPGDGSRPPPPEEAGRPPDRVEPPPPKDPKAEAEERAAKIADSAWTDARDGKWVRVRELVRVLRASLAETETVHRRREQLEALERLAVLESDGPLALLHGAVKQLDRDRVRLSYDFRDAEQAEDWHYLKPFAVMETGTFRAGGSEAPAGTASSAGGGEAVLHGEGTGSFLLDVVFEGDVSLGLRLRSEKPQNLGAMMFDPDDETRFILYILSNTFFTLGAERRALPGNHIVLFGRDTWADTPNAELGFVRVKSETEPLLEAGQWTYFAVGREGDQAFLTISNRKMTGATKGDDGKPFGDLRPALFVLGTQAEFAEVIVEGRPSRAWLARERQTLRKILGL